MDKTVIELRSQNIPIRKIASILNITHSKVQRILKKIEPKKEKPFTLPKGTNG